MSPGSEKSRGAKYGNNAKKHKSGVVPDDLLLNRVRPQGMEGAPMGVVSSIFSIRKVQPKQKMQKIPRVPGQ